MIGICGRGEAVMASVFAMWVGEAGGGRLAGEAQETICTYEGTVGGVAVECHTPDGRAGTVKIGEERFDLTKGAVFLVAKSGAKSQVKQMRLASLNLKPEGSLTPEDMTYDYLRELARTDPEIRAFWAEASNQK